MWIAPHSRTDAEESSSPVVPPVAAAGLCVRSGGSARQVLRLIRVIGLCLLSASAGAREFIRFAPPAFLGSPTISRAALGATYLYRGHDQFAGTELRITVARQPPEMSARAAPSAAVCLELFEGELRRQYPDLYALSSALRLRVGPHDFSQIRWTRRQGAAVVTGVLACGVHRDHFVAISYGANSALALRLFPEIRQQLGRLELNF